MSFVKNRVTSSFYLYLLIGTNVCLLFPPTRLIAALTLICFLPGYFLVRRFTLWGSTFFVAVEALSLSFLIAPLIPLPACIVFQKINSTILIGSTDLFLLIMIFFLKKEKRSTYQEIEGSHSRLIFFIILLVCLWVYIYLDITKLGPYDYDWIYLSGIVNELSTNFPPRNPGASFLPLKQPWGFWFIFSIIHKLGGISTWDVWAVMSIILSFIFLGLVLMILFEITKDYMAGLGAILFLTIGKYSEWIFHSLKNGAWPPTYNIQWQWVHAITGYALLWGWYTLPGMIPPLTSFYFLIRYINGKDKANLFLSLGACSIAPFFHPVYYIAYLIGLSFFFLNQALKRRLSANFFIYFITFIPYLLTFYLYYRPSIPDYPIYLFQLDRNSILTHIRSYLGTNGIAIPLAIIALVQSKESREWIFPFSLLFTGLYVLGRAGLNQVHLWLLDSVYMSLLAGIGLAYLKKINKRIFILVLIFVVLVITPPFLKEVSDRIKVGWKGIINSEQMAAGDFIRKMTHSKDNFLMLPNSRFSAETIIGIGERAVTLGFSFHLERTEKIKSVFRWEEEINKFFLISDANKRDVVLKKYNVDYIFLGPDEMDWMKEHKVDIENFRSSYRIIYQNPEIQILQANRQGKTGGPIINPVQNKF